MSQLTSFQETSVTSPNWSPNGSQITFLARKKGTSSQFQAQMITVDDGSLYQVEVNKALMAATINMTTTHIPELNLQSSIIWLP